MNRGLKAVLMTLQHHSELLASACASETPISVALQTLVSHGREPSSRLAMPTQYLVH